MNIRDRDCCRNFGGERDTEFDNMRDVDRNRFHD